MFNMGGRKELKKSAHTPGENSKAEEQALCLKIKRQTKQTQKAIDQLSQELDQLSKQLDAEVAKRKARTALLQDKKQSSKKG